jgi:hypothetical protein
MISLKTVWATTGANWADGLHWHSYLTLLAVLRGKQMKGYLILDRSFIWLQVGVLCLCGGEGSWLRWPPICTSLARYKGQIKS